YSIFDIHPLLADEFVRRGATPGGLTSAMRRRTPLTSEQQHQIVTFEAGIFTAQIHDDNAAELTAAGANGGPTAFAKRVTKFFIGINDPFGLNPTGAVFSSAIFHLYDSWREMSGGGAPAAPSRAASSSSTAFRSISPAYTDRTTCSTGPVSAGSAARVTIRPTPVTIPSRRRSISVLPTPGWRAHRDWISRDCRYSR